MADNLGLKLVPLAIALFGIVGNPVALAVESGGDSDAAIEANSGDPSRAAQCEKIENAMAAVEELRSELPNTPNSESETPAQSSEVIEVLRGTSRILVRASEIFSTVSLSDDQLERTMERLKLLLSSASSDLDEAASLVAVVETQRQQLSQSGEVNPDDPESLQDMAEPLANVAKMMTLLNRVNQTNDEIKTLFTDLERHCAAEAS
ncbi:MAG: hypothetical protein AAF685_11955 [Cyanobacteria bacterium P01_C01_bin.89]